VVLAEENVVKGGVGSLRVLRNQTPAVENNVLGHVVLLREGVAVPLLGSYLAQFFAGAHQRT
jgi:hypothetical protein